MTDLEIQLLKERIVELEQENQRLSIWRDEIIDICIINFLSMDWDANPRETIAKLIQWEIEMALDPRISAQAQDLINQGYAMACRDTKPGDL